VFFVSAVVTEAGDVVIEVKVVPLCQCIVERIVIYVYMYIYAHTCSSCLRLRV